MTLHNYQVFPAAAGGVNIWYKLPTTRQTGLLATYNITTHTVPEDGGWVTHRRLTCATLTVNMRESGSVATMRTMEASVIRTEHSPTLVSQPASQYPPMHTL